MMRTREAAIPGGRMATYGTNPQVIHETIEGETIIIDLASGTYYSLQGSGPEIWNLVAAGEPATAIVDRLTHADGAPRDVVEPAVDAFLGELQRERLVAPIEPSAAATREAVVELSRNGHGSAFSPPKLEKYTDMQDIILLDPVHQVDDARGWPNAAPQTAA
jgi:hypothetical protein